MEQILTTKTASEKFGLTPEYYRKLIRQGKLSAWSSNPQYFFEKDLKQTLEDLKNKPAEDIRWN